MEFLVCPSCGSEHLDEGAQLGHRLPCADCLLAEEIAHEAATPVEHPIAA